MKHRMLGRFEETVLLAVIALGRSHAYGFNLLQAIERATGRTASLGAIYVTLDRLTDKGYIESELGEPTPERGGKRKRFYWVTGQGEAALAETAAKRIGR